jgi:hypothetical protein
VGRYKLGAALVIGVVPLGRAVNPTKGPWWVPGGLVLGAVLLVFGLLLLAIPEGKRAETQATADAENVSRQNRALRDELQAAQDNLRHFRDQAVSEKHEQQLRELLAELRIHVVHDQPGPTGNDRRAINGHFSKLGADVDDWDDVVTCYNARSEELDEAIGREATRAGITEPVYAAKLLIPLITATVRLRANMRQLDASFAPEWYQNVAPQEEILGLPEAGFVWMKGIDDGPVINLAVMDGLTLEKATRRVERLVMDAKDWWETKRFMERDEDCHRSEFRDAILEQIAELLKRDHLKVRDGCPRCD